MRRRRVYRLRNMNDEEILDNYNRGRIHGYLLGQKIANYNQIKRDLGLNNGSVSYHLSVLEKRELIKSVKKGHRRYFYVGNLPKNFLDDDFTEMECAIMTMVAESSGISQSKLAKEIGVSPSTITYHTKKLEKDEYLKKERRGMRMFFFPKAEPI